MAWPRTIAQNVLFGITSIASAIALSSAVALANIVVPHFVPTDRSYGFLPGDSLADEPGRAAVTIGALLPAAAAAAILLASRRRAPAPVAPTAIALAPLALAAAVFSVLGSADVFRAIVFVPVASLCWFGFVRAFDRGRRRVAVMVPLVVAGAIVFIAGLTLYDALGPDAAAFARDREKISSIRYAGTHYARYPGSPWTEKPPATTTAEMSPLHLEYRQIDRDHYRLCTTFERSRSTDRRFPHGVGRTCFVMTFDDSY